MRPAIRKEENEMQTLSTEQINLIGGGLHVTAAERRAGYMMTTGMLIGVVFATATYLMGAEEIVSTAVGVVGAFTGAAIGYADSVINKRHETDTCSPNIFWHDNAIPC